MTDLQKDQAIYEAMLRVANKFFNLATECSEGFREFMAEKSIISLKELTKCDAWTIAVSDVCEKYAYESMKETIDVDTFHCEFLSASVFGMLDYYKALAKNRCEVYFTYEDVPQGKKVCSVDVDFNDAKGAKKMTEHLSNDEMRPIMNYVLAEINTAAQSINFVASDGRSLAVITNRPYNWTESFDNGKSYRALISKNDWKRLCDYSKKSKSAVRFDVYFAEGSENEPSLCTMVASMGDAKIRFTGKEGLYPNWRSVLPDIKGMRRYELSDGEGRKLQSWLKSVSKDRYGSEHITASVYSGSDRMYFDYSDFDFNKESSVSFRMTEASDVTEGIALSVKKLMKSDFNGIFIEQQNRAAYIICDGLDLLLLMPWFMEDKCVSHVEEREVTAVECRMQTA